MEYEIWASDSGNRLFATADLNEALSWALDYWLAQGVEAVDALSVGDDEDGWVVRGTSLRELLTQRFWRPSALWATVASGRFEESLRLVAA